MEIFRRVRKNLIDPSFKLHYSMSPVPERERPLEYPGTRVHRTRVPALVRCSFRAALGFLACEHGAQACLPLVLEAIALERSSMLAKTKVLL